MFLGVRKECQRLKASVVTEAISAPLTYMATTLVFVEIIIIVHM